jgi:hypothetical protein
VIQNDRLSCPDRLVFISSNQRSRRDVESGTVCYLRGDEIASTRGTWDRDHLPPRRIFALSIKAEFSPQLDWLYAHKGDTVAQHERQQRQCLCPVVGEKACPISQETRAA